MVLNTPSLQTPQFKSSIYLDAYSRINGMVVVGEGLADRHFRLLARAIPEDQQELERLAAMEGRHASDFVGCGRNLGVKPDVGLARQLFAPLHALFLERDRAGDLAGCLVIQGLVVECFAVAAYRHYLPVADAYAAPITAAVIADEGEHLGYAEHWLRERFAAVETSAAAIAKRALPITLSILQSLTADLQAIGMDPIELVASFSELFQQTLETIGFEPPAARRILAGAAAAMV
jgi:fatty aldehyde decarbonylase